MVSRRNLFRWLFSGLLVVLMALGGKIIAQYLIPPPKKRKEEEVAIPIDQIPPGSGLVIRHQGTPVILINVNQNITAFSAICTHLGCLVKWVGQENIFLCPCHAARFDPAGKVLSGPAPEPLHPIKVKVVNGNVVFS